MTVTKAATGTSADRGAERSGAPAGSRRRLARTGAVALVAGAVAATVLTAPAQAGDRIPAEDGKKARHAATQQAVEAIVASGTPGVTVTATDANGVWRSAAGIGDRETGKKRGANDRFRVASITKTFVATVLLQMEAEAKLSLDDTVEKWLPGLIRGNGNDGRKITVRQLLNHTSGIYNYTSDPDYQQKYLLDGFLKHRYDNVPPEYHVKVALAHAPDFPPGTRFQYSNTGYVLAGMIIERVGGRTYEDEVRKRIIKPLKLRATANPGDTIRLPGPSSRAYSKLIYGQDAPNAKIHDVTDLHGSQGWADGDIISSAADLNRFYRALMRGQLLSPPQLKAMKTTGPEGYGLGLYKGTLSCGTTIWGHGGGGPGTLSESVTTEDGGHQLAFNTNGDWASTPQQFINVSEAEFCGRKPGAVKPGAAKSGAAESGAAEPGAVKPGAAKSGTPNTFGAFRTTTVNRG
ncbi:serine hydrolase domain-containing protein [Streptomyces qinzhouensis]|uniref:Beta-lactamase family protein n=1 Tax=Streptomyces qinzhouensis TaxID=2599401 RepID=A0A5B8J8D6_9ACTN|nr:serine hydrolase domain-containing protein [Streptomyces qinzhouensis]QDY77617.1 beta-lactamase family protein [Streptomyces qinzhouensis]